MRAKAVVAPPAVFGIARAQIDAIRVIFIKNATTNRLQVTEIPVRIGVAGCHLVAVDIATLSCSALDFGEAMIRARPDR